MLKRAMLGALELPGVARPFRLLLKQAGTILMLHRMEDSGRGVEGDSAAGLRASLEYLRAEGFELLDLERMFNRAAEGRDLGGAVAFTLDDGYLDQATIAGEIFAAYDCPATIFATSGFMDGELWFWWDQIEYVLERTSRAALSVRLDGQPVELAWSTPGERARQQKSFIERCKRVPDAAKHRAIDELAAEAEVELPMSPPDRYRPMSWDQARSLERCRVRIGCHTETHPILSMTPDAQSRRELEVSWRRLREELESPVPVFCYPNGGAGDFGDREVETLRRLGLMGAVVGTPGHLLTGTFRSNPASRFTVRRFVYPSDRRDLIQYVSGFERLKQVIRREVT